MSVFVLQGNDAPRRLDYAAELNQEQLDVVLHGDGPCLVLAGAGSGKTRTVTYRVSYLLERGVDPSQILLLTFTNKAAREMLHRVEHLLGRGSSGIWGGTFHSMGNRILRKHAEIVGHTASFTILDQEDAQSLLKAVMKELHIDPKARRFPTANVVHNIISYARNTLKPLSEVLEAKHPHFLEFAAEIEDIGRRYLERKQASNAMDFDDLLVNWLNVMNHPVAGDRLAQQFKYVLVDEYQDTNALQALIVQALGKTHGNVLVVGDDAQSIYAFRGADVRNILGFPARWPDTRIFKLLTNYRSVPEILDVANESLSHNRAQFRKDLVAMRPRGDKPTVVPAASARQEAQFIAEQILLLRNEGVALANMACLFRSSAHSQALEFELMKRDVPYEYRGGMKFFERAHIKDVLSYVRVAANVKDEAGWLRVLNLQNGIGAATAASILAKVRHVEDLSSALSAVSLPPRAAAGWKEFSKVAERLMTQGGQPGRMVRVVMDTGYRDYLEREYPDWRDRAEDLEQLANFAEGYAAAADFLSDIALYDESVTGRDKNDGGAEERLVLSTIHQAKGLEWDTVFIIHLADQSFPSKRSMSEEDGLEEERRLFYVAVTRARRKLFLTYPQTGGGYDSFSLNSPSTFIEEVPPRLFERMELREAVVVRGPSQGRGGNMNTGTVWKKGDTTDEARANWSWDDEGPTIEIDDNGDRKNATGTVWKSSSAKKLPPTSFLSDISDL